jgi:hypothetical protein
MTRYCLNRPGSVHELAPLGWELAATVEIVKQGNAARKIAKEHVKLAVCD